MKFDIPKTIKNGYIKTTPVMERPPAPKGQKAEQIKHKSSVPVSKHKDYAEQKKGK